MTRPLTAEYADKIRPLLPLARRAYGPRDRLTPAHDASRKMTKLLAEYVRRGGNINALASELGVSSPGLRRRVLTADLPVIRQPRGRLRDPAQVTSAVENVKAARAMSVDAYHDALLREYERGVPMSKLADEMGMKSAYPLYYGIDRARARRKQSA